MQGVIKTCVIFLLSVAVCRSQVRDIFRDIKRIFNIGDGVIDDAEEIRTDYDFIVIGAGGLFYYKTIANFSKIITLHYVRVIFLKNKFKKCVFF